MEKVTPVMTLADYLTYLKNAIRQKDVRSEFYLLEKYRFADDGAYLVEPPDLKMVGR